MNKQEIKEIFDQQAAGYDERWEKTAPVRDGLLFLLAAVFTKLNANARILCVGVGTGDEMIYLAKRFPEWTFTAVEPSGAMLELCRSKMQQAGFAARCDFHEGYLDSLPSHDKFDAATCFLVSQFILERNARIDFFREIAARLQVGGILASSDLASDISSGEYADLLQVWLSAMKSADISDEALEKMRKAYAKDVAILHPTQIENIIRSSGFVSPVRFYQAGLIHAWFSKRSDEA
jgi:tRNA (cmo5U34)-methyltransferase